MDERLKAIGLGRAEVPNLFKILWGRDKQIKPEFPLSPDQRALLEEDCKRILLKEYFGRKDFNRFVGNMMSLLKNDDSHSEHEKSDVHLVVNRNNRSIDVVFSKLENSHRIRVENILPVNTKISCGSFNLAVSETVSYPYRGLSSRRPLHELYFRSNHHSDGSRVESHAITYSPFLTGEDKDYDLQDLPIGENIALVINLKIFAGSPKNQEVQKMCGQAYGDYKER